MFYNTCYCMFLYLFSYFIICLLFIFYSLSFFNSSIMFSIEWQIDKRTGGLMDGQTIVSFKQARLTKETNTTTAKNVIDGWHRGTEKSKPSKKIDNHYNDCNNNSRFSFKKYQFHFSSLYRFVSFLFCFYFYFFFKLCFGIWICSIRIFVFFLLKKLQQNYQHN